MHREWCRWWTLLKSNMTGGGIHYPFQKKFLHRWLYDVDSLMVRLGNWRENLYSLYVLFCLESVVYGFFGLFHRATDSGGFGEKFWGAPFLYGVLWRRSAICDGKQTSGPLGLTPFAGFIAGAKAPAYLLLWSTFCSGLPFVRLSYDSDRYAKRPDSLGNRAVFFVL